jgi:biotin carboxylase
VTDTAGWQSTRRPLVVVGYGPRCIPVMEIVEAATGVCDLLWLVDESLPEMTQMRDLLRRFGPVVDITGSGPATLASELRGHHPDGIVTFLDAGMITYAALAAELGLSFHTPATAAALVDKSRQREALRQSGLPVPRCFVVPSGGGRDALAALGAELHWPAVLKPRSAQGSRNTFLAQDSDHAARLLDALGPDRKEMVLEDYLEGDPDRADGPYADYLSVESLVSRGVISHIALTGRFPLAENFRETGFFIPAALEIEDQDAVLNLATSAIRALAVETGCLHTEIKFTPEGPRIIEVNGRVGGGVPEMLMRAAGIPLLELTLRIALGESVHLDGPVSTDRIGYRFFLQPPPMSATIGAIDGIDAVADHPGVDAVSIHQGPGADVDWRDGSRSHVLAVVGAADDYAELQAVDRLLHREVTVTYSELAL